VPPEIQAFFENYRDAFNVLDGGAVADLYSEPAGIAQDGNYTHWPDRQAVAENMEALCKLYKHRGFIRAEFELGQFIDQGTQYAIADIQRRIDWSSGEAPWSFRATYNMVRAVRGWKVMLCTAYSEAALYRATSAA